jgi:type VI secretion system secreted protein VgrG
MNWRTIISHVVQLEGGKVNDPDDSGGKTNFGITQATFSSFKRAGLIPSIRANDVYDLSRDDAFVFYEAYARRAKIDKIKSWPIKYAIFDFYVNSGSNAFKSITSALGSKTSSLPDTVVDEINSSNERDTFLSIIKLREDYYNEIVRRRPSQEKFLRGWMNRLNKVKMEEGKTRSAGGKNMNFGKFELTEKEIEENGVVFTKRDKPKDSIPKRRKARNTIFVLVVSTLALSATFATIKLRKSA